MSPRRWLSGLVVVVAACGGSRPAAAPPPEPPPEGYRATVRWTSFDVPHVIANDLGSLGFGQGWATAKQHLCRLADQFVRVASERARWFGPGDGDSNLDSDFLHLHLGLTARAEALIARQSPEANAVHRGWVAGYNHYVAHTPRDRWPEACRDAAWVQAIDEVDLARFGLGLATIASSRMFEAAIAGAAPDGGRAAALPMPAATPAAMPASNGWALGGDFTETGHGMVLANPHFPWEGDLTFSEIHLTLRGELDVYGANIPGVPMVGIGFTPRVAWTHTFSSSTRFLLYQLRLVEGEALVYHRDQGVAQLEAQPYQIDVLQPDGSTARVSRTLYRSIHGPMVTAQTLPWSTAAGTAFSLRDVALDSVGSATDMYLGFARAAGFDEFRAAMAGHTTPFLNTMYADVEGNAWYVDGSSVPDLRDDALAKVAWAGGVAVVDGSSSVYDLPADQPAVPIDGAPELLRRDFVFNANDSYGYSNPAAPMSGHSPLYGAADAAPSPRSLMNLRMLTERGISAASGRDAVFSRQEAVAAMLSNRSFTGEQLREEVLDRCRAGRPRIEKPAASPKKKPKGKRKPIRIDDVPVVVGLEELCTRLTEWDLRFGVDSRGAMLWRELMIQLAPTGELPWAVAFDPAVPGTPSGLVPAKKGEPDPLLGAIGRAGEVLTAAGFDLRRSSPTLGELQRAAVGSRGPVPGGVDLDGVANMVRWAPWNGTLLPRASREAPISRSGLGPDGYPVNYGTSWLMAVDLLPGGPDADVLMTYGPPRTPDGGDLDDDQLHLFARGRLRHALFDEQEITADPNLVVVEIESQP